MFCTQIVNPYLGSIAFVLTHMWMMVICGSADMLLEQHTLHLSATSCFSYLLPSGFNLRCWFWCVNFDGMGSSFLKDYLFPLTSTHPVRTGRRCMLWVPAAKELNWVGLRRRAFSAWHPPFGTWFPQGEIKPDPTGTYEIPELGGGVAGLGIPEKWGACKMIILYVGCQSVSFYFYSIFICDCV